MGDNINALSHSAVGLSVAFPDSAFSSSSMLSRSYESADFPSSLSDSKKSEPPPKALSQSQALPKEQSLLPPTASWFVPLLLCFLIFDFRDEHKH